MFSHQYKNNENFLCNETEVLVENRIENQNKLFGRNKYLTPVIFDGNDDDIGKLVTVTINNFNQNTLFGKVNKQNIKAA